MIFTAVYQILSTDETWNPTDFYNIDFPEALVEKLKAKVVSKQAEKLLQQEALLLFSFTPYPPYHITHPNSGLICSFYANINVRKF